MSCDRAALHEIAATTPDTNWRYRLERHPDPYDLQASIYANPHTEPRNLARAAKDLEFLASKGHYEYDDPRLDVHAENIVAAIAQNPKTPAGNDGVLASVAAHVAERAERRRFAQEALHADDEDLASMDRSGVRDLAAATINQDLLRRFAATQALGMDTFIAACENPKMHSDTLHAAAQTLLAAVASDGDAEIKTAGSPQRRALWAICNNWGTDEPTAALFREAIPEALIRSRDDRVDTIVRGLEGFADEKGSALTEQDLEGLLREALDKAERDLIRENETPERIETAQQASRRIFNDARALYQAG